MMFPVTSTSVETERIARAIRVMQRRPKRAKLISKGEVYNCKVDDEGPPKLYSAHAFGDAVDFMCDQGADALEFIAKAAIRDATHLSVFNRMRKTEVRFVIWETTQWVDGHISPYDGVPHTNHVHVACSFSTVHVPACAGGTNYPIPYVGG